MTFEFSTHGFEAPIDLVEFARVTTLFEIWRPRRPWSRMTVRVQSATRGRSRFRCRIEVEGGGAKICAEAIATDAFEVVRAAAQSLLVPEESVGAPSDSVVRPADAQPSGSASVTHPCDAS